MPAAVSVRTDFAAAPKGLRDLGSAQKRFSSSSWVCEALRLEAARGHDDLVIAAALAVLAADLARTM